MWILDRPQKAPTYKQYLLRLDCTTWCQLWDAHCTWCLPQQLQDCVTLVSSNSMGALGLEHPSKNLVGAQHPQPMAVLALADVKNKPTKPTNQPNHALPEAAAPYFNLDL